MLSSWILLKIRTRVQFRGAFKLHHTDCCTQPDRRPMWITCCCDNIYLSSIHQKVHSCCTCTQSQCIKTTIGSWLYRVHSVPFVQTAMTASWGFLLIVGWFLIFIGPRCPWGPIYGSGCLSLTESKTFVQTKLMWLWLMKIPTQY